MSNPRKRKKKINTFMLTADMTSTRDPDQAVADMDVHLGESGNVEKIVWGIPKDYDAYLEKIKPELLGRKKK